MLLGTKQWNTLGTNILFWSLLQCRNRHGGLENTNWLCTMVYGISNVTKGSPSNTKATSTSRHGAAALEAQPGPQERARGSCPGPERGTERTRTARAPEPEFLERTETQESQTRANLPVSVQTKQRRFLINQDAPSSVVCSCRGLGLSLT